VERVSSRASVGVVDPEPAQHVAHPQLGRHLAVVLVVGLGEVAIALRHRVDERVERDVARGCARARGARTSTRAASSRGAR
jgi:hypothetical protein